MSRRRWVALATDSAPTYAIFAPIVTWLWRRLGYRALIFIHDDEEGWATRFGQLVIGNLREAGALLVPLPTVPPLSYANTMRCARLVAASLAEVADDDFILTADMDMFPLSRNFFDRSEDLIALRALYHVWEMPRIPKPPTIDAPLQPGEHRFAMCYFGATARIWRKILPLVVGDPLASLRAIAPAEDSIDNDEVKLSRGVLTSHYAQGRIEAIARGHWKQGDLHLVDPIDGPNLSGHIHLSRSLIWLQHWQTVRGTPEAAEAIDFIPPRFPRGSDPWWCFDVARVYFPEDAVRIDAYERVARAEIATARWPETKVFPS